MAVGLIIGVREDWTEVVGDVKGGREEWGEMNGEETGSEVVDGGKVEEGDCVLAVYGKEVVALVLLAFVIVTLEAGIR